MAPGGWSGFDHVARGFFFRDRRSQRNATLAEQIRPDGSARETLGDYVGGGVAVASPAPDGVRPTG